MSRIERILESVLERGLQRRSPGAVPAFAPGRVERILVLNKHNIGDVLCTTPALRALRKAFPKAFLAILVSEHCRPVLEQNPDLDEIFTYTKSKHRADWLGLPAQWDLWDVIRRLRAAASTWPSPWVVPPAGRGVAGLRLRGALAAWICRPGDTPVRLFPELGARPRTGHVARGGRNAGALGLHRHPPGRARTDPGARSRGAGDHPPPSSGGGMRGGCAAGPGTYQQPARVQPVALTSFAKTADFLQERLGLTVLLSWAPGDASNPLFPGDDGKAEDVARQMRTRPILLPTPTLSELIAAMSLSNLILSTDGGPMHMAAALDVPQVVLFGKTGQAHWAPISEKCAILQRGQRVDGIAVEEVEAAISAVMARWGRRTATVRGNRCEGETGTGTGRSTEAG